MTKTVCILLIFSILVPLSSASGLSTKTQGKMTLAFILLGIGVLTKYLIHLNEKKVEDLHTKLGQPEQVMEYRKGFDKFRIERYGEKQYKFRNGVLLKQITNYELRVTN